jgi:hypothetical protein
MGSKRPVQGSSTPTATTTSLVQLAEVVSNRHTRATAESVN